MRLVRSVAAVLAALTLLSCAARVRGAEVPPLEKQLLAAARNVLEFAKAGGYQSLGVLKFRVKQGARPATDRAGAINATLADRLELALILKNKVQEPVLIVHDASAVAAQLPGATHLTKEGRAQFFTAEYPVAWGTSKSTPDLFVTGAVSIPDDLSTMTVSIQGFTRDGDLVPMFSFEARPGLNEVLETGGSFTRGSNSRPGLSNAGDWGSPVAEAALVMQGKAEHPATASSAPIAMDIQYDGQTQPVQVRDGRAYVAEPRERQRVSLVLRRRDPKDRRRLAVVVKVNGENTLYKQRLPDPQCAGWILLPEQTQSTITGYQLDGSRREDFRVLSRAESETKRMDYGRDVGTISFTVYGELGTQQPPAPTSDILDEDGEDFAVLTASQFPAKPSANLGALKQSLIVASSRSARTRALVVPGDVQQVKVNTVNFTADPTPLMLVSIIYYKS